MAAVASLGRYQVLRRLAAGGMAELFLARAEGVEGFAKLVVLKRVLPHLATNGELVRMFLNEGRLTGTLNHPGIAQVYDLGQTDDTFFIAMEFVHGENVGALLAAEARRGQRLPLAEALTIVNAVASALHYAHERRAPGGRPLGIVHRDVSPSNVMVSFQGAVKLVDFGVAKAAWSSYETRAGVVKGKLPFMSPEQLRAQPLDRRTDVFSLGLLLYLLTTGRHPFAEESEYEDAVALRLMSLDVPAPSRTIRDYPRELERILLRALRRDVEERYATAEALQTDIEAFAARAGLALSPIALARYMRELFGEHPEPEYLQEAPDAVAPAVEFKVVSLLRSTPEPEPAAAPAAPTAPPPRRRLAILVAGAALILGSVGLFAALAGGGEPEPAVPRAAAAEVVNASTPPPVDAAPAAEPDPIPTTARADEAEPGVEVTTTTPPTTTSPPARPRSRDRARPKPTPAETQAEKAWNINSPVLP